MLTGQDVLVAYERRQDDLALARKERLIGRMQRSNSSHAALYQRWLAQLGARLVSWTYLQARDASNRQRIKIRRRKESKMSAMILDGRAVAQQIRNETHKEVAVFRKEWGSQPTLALVLAGANPASISYARMIKRTCEESGISFQVYTEPTDIREGEMVALLRELSADEMVHGIILQKPMPGGINDAAVIEALDPAKDVDGAHPLNAGRLAQAAFVGWPQDIGPYFVPATPLGGLELLKRYNIEIDGRRAVIVAASNLIGKPLAMLLLCHWATVTVCDLHTYPLGEMTR